MAFQHLFYNRQTVYGQMLANVMLNLDIGLNNLNGLIGTVQLMINGDGSQDVHYAEITSRFGFVDDLSSHQAFNELLAVQGKINVDTSVTNVRTAIVQAINKFR